ncbi:Phosphatidylinositol-4-phosphate_5-kinase [Hexamita inflata]|uniref:Putative n=1 Tax=Hexamita inflata TaxID=28002 RepID=A0AA86U086_9EUKA|nr:Phosphatidylinositol-4-phosphate 5-kinase [Hexamita inflata]
MLMSTMWYTNGTVYEGEWLNGMPHGKGKYYYFSCDSVAQGNFEFGRILNGELQLRDGSKWIGEFELNQPHGKGQWVMNGWVQKGTFVEINPPQKEEGEEEEKEAEKQEEDEEKEIQEEAEEDEEKMAKMKEEKEKEEGEEAKEEEDGETKEKIDPREKTLKALLPPKRTRKTLTVEIPKLSKMRTLKLKWVPEGLPEKQ